MRRAALLRRAAAARLIAGLPGRLLLSVLATALASTAAAAPPPSAPLGRLFTTPAERAQLDAGRGGAVAPPAVPLTALAPAAAAPGQSVTLNGVVRRSSGKSTIWLNDVPQNDAQNQFVPGQARQPGAAASLALRDASGKQVLLKAGQSYQLEDGTVTEDYGR